MLVSDLLKSLEGVNPELKVVLSVYEDGGIADYAEVSDANETYWKGDSPTDDKESFIISVI